jgi:hypothetical protein
MMVFSPVIRMRRRLYFNMHLCVTSQLTTAVCLAEIISTNLPANFVVFYSLLRLFDEPSRNLKSIQLAGQMVSHQHSLLIVSNCIDELSYPLSLLFTFSFEHGILPESWLTSFISPIFKKGNSADANNYRPIALTDCMCKLMETIIKDQIVHFLAATGLISKSQHAFIKQHSTATNLLASLHDWSIGLNSHLCTDIVVHRLLQSL